MRFMNGVDGGCAHDLVPVSILFADDPSGPILYVFNTNAEG